MFVHYLVWLYISMWTYSCWYKHDADTISIIVHVAIYPFIFFSEWLYIDLDQGTRK